MKKQKTDQVIIFFLTVKINSYLPHFDLNFWPHFVKNAENGQKFYQRMFL